MHLALRSVCPSHVWLPHRLLLRSKELNSYDNESLAKSGGGFFLGTDDTTFYKKRHGLLLEKAVSLE
jgi:hypothetical protein